jgi:hypothetical protein
VKNLWTAVHVGILDHKHIGEHRYRYRLLFPTSVVTQVSWAVAFAFRTTHKPQNVCAPTKLNQLLLELL